MLASLFCTAVLTTLATAQTSTKCNPLLVSNCPPDPALGTTYNQTFNGDSSINTDYWTVLAGPAATFGDNGAEFTITEHGDSPTIQSNFYIFWGKVEVIMQAAAGQGIISSIVLLSDDLDEVDWEVMGGNSSFVETNYYGKGNQSERNALYYPCDNPETTFHNYTTVWNSGQVEWHLDGQVVRTLPYGQAMFNGNSSFPQTPMHLKIGNWAGGDPSEPQGTISWAGGVTDYTKGPFNMMIKSVKVVDGTTNATQYVYGDTSGSWQSIQIKEGVSQVSKVIHAPPPLTLSQHWAKLSTGARVAIVIIIVIVLVVALVAFFAFCIKQRRLGRKERALADAQWEKEEMELLQYRQQMNAGAFGMGAKQGALVYARPLN